MRHIYSFFIDRPLIVNTITVMIFVVGGLCLWDLHREMFPKVDFGIITISTISPGASAEDIEQSVTIPVERKIKNVEGIKNFHAMSMEGRSLFFIVVDPDNDEAQVKDDITNEVRGIDDFPDDTEYPVIRSASNSTRQLMDVAIRGRDVNVNADVDYSLLRSGAKEVRDRLERLSPVRSVKLGGYQVDEILVEVDPIQLDRYELTMGEIARSLRDRNLNLTGGKIKQDDEDITIRTVAEFENLEDVRNVVVRSNDTGKRVQIRDIAQVVRAPSEGKVLQRSQGKRAIFLSVRAKENVDVLKAADLIKSEVATVLSEKQYAPLTFSFADDLSYYVKRRLDVLKTSALIGMFLVVCCLLFFLNGRTSIITSLGAPLAFMISFIAMSFMGLSFNMISMFGLILVLGMLVDDSIIVAEYYYQKLEQGIPRKQAALQAALHTMAPITATILTTIAAFGSMFFMGGIMGKFIWQIPLMVIICLIASLIECFLIMPSHLNEFVSLKKGQKEKTWYKKMQAHYAKWLERFLRHPGKVLCAFGATFVFSLILATMGMRFQLFPGDDIRKVFFQIKGPVGANHERTGQEVAKLERWILDTFDKSELRQIKARVGELSGPHANKTGGHYGSIILYLELSNKRDRSTDEIVSVVLKEARKRIDPAYEIIVKKNREGPPQGKPILIELLGEDLDDLRAASRQVEKKLAQIKGVMATEVDFEEGKRQWVAKVKEEEVKRLGLSTRKVAFELRQALSENKVTEIREGDDDIEVKILLNDKSRKPVETLSLLHVANAQGYRIPLNRVVEWEERPGAFVIRRLNRKRAFAVSAQLDQSKTSSLEVAKAITKDVETIVSQYPSMSFLFGGENEDTADSMRGLLKAGVIALCLIFLILIIMFGSLGQPVVVMSAIPLGLIGVVFTFFLFGKSLGFMALMGIIALVGVVVNDSIVLVNFINKERKEMGEKMGEKINTLRESVLKASKDRFRPVILTTVTTVAGLLPLAHLPGGDPFIKPMAMSFAWGLLFSTAVTLVFIPCNYLLYTRFANRLSEWFSK